jgi:hypothetical protein
LENLVSYADEINELDGIWEESAKVGVHVSMRTGGEWRTLVRFPSIL